MLGQSSHGAILKANACTYIRDETEHLKASTVKIRHNF